MNDFWQDLNFQSKTKTSNGYHYANANQGTELVSAEKELLNQWNTWFFLILEIFFLQFCDMMIQRLIEISRSFEPSNFILKTFITSNFLNSL